VKLWKANSAKKPYPEQPNQRHFGQGMGQEPHHDFFAFKNIYNYFLQEPKGARRRKKKKAGSPIFSWEQCQQVRKDLYHLNSRSHPHSPVRIIEFQKGGKPQEQDLEKYIF